jgi:nucleoside phosphorylase
MPDMSKAQLLSYAQRHRLRRALVVTALPIETQAVRAHIKQLASILGRAGTIYECGQFSAIGEEWLVVVAESGAGTHPAQVIVTNAHIDFEAFEVVLFVGVAGSRKREAPIGSVVASRVVYYAHSGKHDPEHGFAYRPRTFPIVPHLVSLASKIERDRKWSARVRAPLHTELPGTDKYPQPFPPSALVAPIISVEAVSADPDSELEAQIAIHNGDAVAVEMEGYGAAHAAYQEQTPFIIVRGISDNRADKNPEADAINQPVAAAHAAAFAFEMLAVLGQFYPSMPALPSTDSTAGSIPSNDGSVTHLTPAESGAASTPMSEFVLNFEGSPADYPSEKIDEILKKLREVTGNPSISLVRTEAGSFRLVVRGTSEDLRKVNAPATYEAFARDLSIKLLGVQDEGEYRRTPAYESALAIASKDLLAWPKNLPDGTHLDRPELAQLLSTITGSESSTIALLAPPGAGKSALLASLGQKLLHRKVPFIAIKADLLDPEIKSEEDLAEFLNFASPVSQILLQLSQLRPVVLLLDQLDALAGYVDLQTGRLNVLLNLVRKLGERRNIHVVVSARTFEYEHDARLKAVRAESLTLSLPPWSAVLRVLEGHGIQAAGWPTDAQELMRTPQALSTFLKLNDRTGQPPFHRYQAMLDQLWKDQILSKPNGPRIAALAGTIAEQMAEKETLWLAATRFEEQAHDLSALIASGVLKDYEGTGGKIGFSHQTVFEHALARFFAKGNRKLSTYILERQASLFVRPKMWAALAYLRDIETATYHDELKAIWSTSGLRLHLRHMLVEFMGQQAEPTVEEAALFRETLHGETRPIALQAMAGSPGWFKIFALSDVAAAMKSASESNLAINILGKAWPFSSNRVLALIKKNWLPDPRNDGAIWIVLHERGQWDQETTEIAKTIIRRTEIATHAFEYLVSEVGVKQPDVALDLIATRLFVLLEKAIAESERRTALQPPEEQEARMIWLINNSPSDPLTNLLEEQNGWDRLEALAKSHPKLFLQFLWPWFQKSLAALCRVHNKHDHFEFPVPYEVDFRFEGENDNGLPEPPLLGSLTVATESLAAASGDEFLTWLAANEKEEASPAQRLFAHALASQPQRYASRSLRFLLDDKRRFFLGNLKDRSGTSKRLVEAVSPFWTEEELAEFEKEVFSYSPAAPGRMDARQRRYFRDLIRRTKLGLFRALPQGRVSANVRKHVTEESRRFPGEGEGGVFTGVRAIGSPIPVHGLARAKDVDILNAFKKLPDATGWDHPKHWGKGGNVQLSREFAEFAKTDPKRAAEIIRKFDPSFGTRASGYALDAMADVAEPELIFDLIETLDQRGFKGHEFHRGAANAIGRLLRRNVAINDKTLEILTSWLSKQEIASDHESNESTNEVFSGDDGKKRDRRKREGSALWGHGGISVLPHGNYAILEAITRIYLGREQPDELLALYAKHLRFGEEQAVWEALLRFFRYIRPADSKRFVEFVSDLFARYPGLESKGEAAVMLAYKHNEHPELVRQVLERWKNTKDEELQQTYGELVCLMALLHPELSWPAQLLDRIIRTKEMASARTGAAYSAVNLWSQSDDHAAAASSVLKSIVPIADEEAWRAIFDLFRLVDEITPDDPWISLLEMIADYLPQAKVIESPFIVERLETVLPHNASLIARVAKGLVANWRADLSDSRTSTAMHAAELVDLAITLHRLGEETREAGTSLFEELLLMNAYTARDTLNEIDNRFWSSPRQARRMLPRRRSRARADRG